MAYDPDLNLLYEEAANPGPWNQEQRPGDNKWTDGIFARDPDTGAAKWYYQYNPHDEHDYDGINEIILLDVPVNGKVRKVLLHRIGTATFTCSIVPQARSSRRIPMAT